MRTAAALRPAARPLLPVSAATLRMALALVVMFLATSAFYNFSFTPKPPEQPGVVGDSQTRGDIVNMAGWLASYGICGLIVLHGLVRQGLEWRLALLLPFALLVLLSSTWAFSPWSSLVLCIMLVANIVIAAALAQQVHPIVLLRALTYVVTFAVAVSLILLVISPALVTSTPDRPGFLIQGEFSGVFGHKVHMGMNSAAALMVLLFDQGAMRSRFRRIVAILICLAGVVLANSASAVVAIVLAIAIVTVARVAPALRTAAFALVGLTTLAVSVLLPYVDIGSITGLLGRSASLTGRTDFWELAPGYILERPWLGYGYGGFFDRDPYSQVWDLWSRFQYFFTPNFHNSALDVTIVLGCVGLAAYVAILTTALFIFRNRSLGRAAEILGCILILFTASSATDFQFMRHNCLATILMFYAFMVGGRRYA